MDTLESTRAAGADAGGRAPRRQLAHYSARRDGMRRGTSTGTAAEAARLEAAERDADIVARELARVRGQAGAA